MKRVIILRWKELIMTCLLVVLIGGIALIVGFGVESNTKTNGNQYYTPQDSVEWLYKDALKTILLPYVQDAVSNYYEKNTGYSPGVDPWTNANIISIESPKAYTFLIKFEVSPYLGAHNSIGMDHITLRISFGEVNVERFEHIKDYPIPPWLQHLE